MVNFVETISIGSISMVWYYLVCVGLVCKYDVINLLLQEKDVFYGTVHI